MKKLVLLVVCMFVFAASGFAQNKQPHHHNTYRGYKGEKGVSSVGVSVGYAIDYKTPVVGIDYRYNILDRLRLAPSLMYAFEHMSYSAWYVNADAHYLARITNKMTIYPIGGLGLSFHKRLEYKNILVPYPDGDYNSGTAVYGELDDVTKTRIGLNLGFGGEMRVTRDIIVGAEFKYNLTTERIYDQAMLLGRVAYYF